MHQDKKTPSRIRIGISTCLLGEKVRYDGGHKRDAFLTEVFGQYVEWVPVCPEVEMGLGIPREPVRLVQQEDGVHFVAIQSGTDHTEKMRRYATERLTALAGVGLRGYVLKRASPSCGMERVRIYQPSGMPERDGSGMFAEALMKRFPHLPVEEEGRLSDPRLRENFVSRVFAYHRWCEMATQGVTRSALTRFHERHKFQLMAHNQAGAKRLGDILGKPGQYADDGEMAAAYLDGFTNAMRRIPTPRNHTNVLQHMVGYFSKRLDPADRAEMTETVEKYRLGLVPLIVPITLIRHYVRKFNVPYLQDQAYLNPHPHELMLLNQL